MLLAQLRNIFFGALPQVANDIVVVPLQLLQTDGRSKREDPEHTDIEYHHVAGRVRVARVQEVTEVTGRRAQARYATDNGAVPLTQVIEGGAVRLHAVC